MALVLDIAFLLSAVQLRGKIVLFVFEAPLLLISSDGVVTESITVLLQTANFSMVRPVMPIRSLLVLQLQELLDLRLGQYHMAGLGFMIVLSLEVC